MTPEASTLAGARAEFDLPDDVAYLDTASRGPRPRVAVEAGWSGLARTARPWTVAPDDATVPVEQLRDAFAHLLGAADDLDGVAVVPSVGYGVATAAAGLDLAAGQGVLVLGRELPSAAAGWARLAARRGGELHEVARPADGDWTAAVLAAIEDLGDRVGVVSVPACHRLDGGVVDLAQVAQAARSLGAAVAVDASQWLGAAPLDVADLRPDHVFGTAHTWLCGPLGVGFCWVAPEHREGTPLEPGRTARLGARRFDGGDVADPALVPTALAAIDLVAAWDPGELVAHTRAATGRVADGATALGLAADPVHLRAPHLIALRGGPDLDVAAVVGALADEGVHVGGAGDALRVSVHAFTSDGDVDRFLAALGRALGRSA